MAVRETIRMRLSPGDEEVDEDRRVLSVHFLCYSHSRLVFSEWTRGGTQQNTTQPEREKLSWVRGEAILRDKLSDKDSSLSERFTGDHKPGHFTRILIVN